MKYFFFFTFFIFRLYSYSQNLNYKSNGNVLNDKFEKISPAKVRELLVNNEQLLADYNAGRSKKTAGNILLYGGLGFITSDIIRKIFRHDKLSITVDETYFPPKIDVQVDKKIKFPSALGYVGLTLVAVSLPIKIGFSKKIKNVVTQYNNQNATGNIDFERNDLNLIANNNGIGFRLTLN